MRNAAYFQLLDAQEREAGSSHSRLRRMVIFVLLGLTAAAIAAEASAKPPIACGVLHSIEGGETLFKIADRAYGDGWQYKRIFAVNRDVLPDEKSIEIGAQVLIPCLDGTGPRTRRAAMAQASVGAVEDGTANPPERASQGPQQVRGQTARTAAIGAQRSEVAIVQGAALAGNLVLGSAATYGQATSTMARAATSGPTLRLLISSGPTPYADERLPQGGMVSALLSEAVRAADPELSLSIDVVTDWSAYLRHLLLDDAFDIALPWYKPACPTPERLGVAGTMLCSRFAFSRAITEIPFGYYAHTGSSVLGTRDHADC